jgi:hypothetical protein
MASTISAGTSAGTAIAIAGDTSGALALQTNNGTTAVTIDTSQNATVVGNITGAALIPSGSTTPTNGVFLPTTNTVAISTASTERMRFTASGRGYFFNAGSAATIGDCIYNFAGTFNGNRGVSFNATDSATDGTMIYFTTQGTYRGGIVCSSGGTAYNSSSDYRLKQNVAPMTNALSKVALLKPVTYTWIADGKDGQGFIAHELAEVCPDAVTGEKDAVDADGNPDYQGIDTSFLVATLTAAIQELNAKVDAQALEIQALKGVA